MPRSAVRSNCRSGLNVTAQATAVKANTTPSMNVALNISAPPPPPKITRAKRVATTTNPAIAALGSTATTNAPISALRRPRT